MSSNLVSVAHRSKKLQSGSMVAQVSSNEAHNSIFSNLDSGCSSLEGFFQENGLSIWTWGQSSPQINPYSWVNLTNVLWVEYPVGVGFSPGKPTATNEEEPAKEFIEFFKNFQVS